MPFRVCHHVLRALSHSPRVSASWRAHGQMAQTNLRSQRFLFILISSPMAAARIHVCYLYLYFLSDFYYATILLLRITTLLKSPRLYLFIFPALFAAATVVAVVSLVHALCVLFASVVGFRHRLHRFPPCLMSHVARDRKRQFVCISSACVFNVKQRKNSRENHSLHMLSHS